MDIEQIVKNPFRFRDEFDQWISSAEQNEENIRYCQILLEKVKGDLASGIYIEKIVCSKLVSTNPAHFLEIFSCSEQDIFLFIEGEIIYYYSLNERFITRKIIPEIEVAYLRKKIDKEGINSTTINTITKLLKLEKPNIKPTLILMILKNADNNPLLFHLLEKIDKPYWHFLLEWSIIIKEPNLIFEKLLIKINKNGTEEEINALWRVVGSLKLSENTNWILIKEIFFNRKIYRLSWCKWGMKQKIEKNPNIIERLFKYYSSFSEINKRDLWEICLEVNSPLTSNFFRKIFSNNSKQRNEFRITASRTEEIYRALFNFGNLTEVKKLYLNLCKYLKKTPFIGNITIKNFSRKEDCLEEIRKLVDQMYEYSNIPPLSELEIELSNYFFLKNLLSKSLGKKFAENKFNEFIVVLTKSRENKEFAKRVLEELNYYVSKYPQFPNDQSQTTEKILKNIKCKLFGDFWKFMSEAYIFNKFCRAGKIVKCDPVFGNYVGEFIVNLGGVSTLVEVKNHESSRDLRLSGVGREMEYKAREDLKGVINQVLIKGNVKVPILLCYDTSSNFLDDFIIDNILHGSLKFMVPKNTQDELFPFREKNFPQRNLEEVKYLQGVLLFKPQYNNKRLTLKGKIISHKYREKFLGQEGFKDIAKSIFSS